MAKINAAAATFAALCALTITAAEVLAVETVGSSRKIKLRAVIQAAGDNINYAALHGGIADTLSKVHA